jgi:hypothetical protein
MSFKSLQGDRHSATTRTGAAMLLRIWRLHQYLSDCTDAVAHVMRSSRGMHSLAVMRQGDSGSLDQMV